MPDISSIISLQCYTLCSLAVSPQTLENCDLAASQELYIDAAECAGGAAQVSKPNAKLDKHIYSHLISQAIGVHTEHNGRCTLGLGSLSGSGQIASASPRAT